MSDENANTIPTADELRATIRAELKADFDSRQKAVDDLIAEELAAASEEVKKLIPESLAPVEQVRWLRKAQASGAFKASPTVPPTDSRRPSNTPTPIDSATLSPIVRIASGYTNSK